MDRTPTKLNHQQIEMLRLLDRPLPEDAYAQIKQAVMKILANQLDEEMEKLEIENGWTAETYKDWGKEHNRSSSK